jgi:hypothetical protein
MTPPRLAPITTAPTQAGLASALVGTEKFAAKIEIKTAKVLVIIPVAISVPMLDDIDWFPKGRS